MLSQEKDGQEQVVVYYSQKFSAPERNYCVTRKELLAVVTSLDHFHSYLYGAPFTVRTDHAALRWLKTLRNPEGQLACWLGKLEQHNYHVVHRPGKAHINADSLSRRPCEPDCRHCSSKELVECQRTVVSVDSSNSEDGWQEAQRKDPDIGPIVRMLESCAARPPRGEVAALSPTAKHYWEQWDTLALGRGVMLNLFTTSCQIARPSHIRVLYPRRNKTHTG